MNCKWQRASCNDSDIYRTLIANAESESAVYKLTKDNNQTRLPIYASVSQNPDVPVLFQVGKRADDICSSYELQTESLKRQTLLEDVPKLLALENIVIDDLCQASLEGPAEHETRLRLFLKTYFKMPEGLIRTA
jgi:hypothetical protein